MIERAETIEHLRLEAEALTDHAAHCRQMMRAFRHNGAHRSASVWATKALLAEQDAAHLSRAAQILENLSTAATEAAA